MISSLGRSPVSVDTGNGPMTVQQEPLPNATERPGAHWCSPSVTTCRAPITSGGVAGSLPSL